MPAVSSKQKYYQTHEFSRMLDMTGNTLFHWPKDGAFLDVEYCNWRAWDYPRRISRRLPVIRSVASPL
jgi:hypothetical protein